MDSLECRDNVIIYTEAYSKNKQGGLAQRHDVPKVVRHYSNEKDPSRCFVRLFKKYRLLCPVGTTAFYLSPLRKPKPEQWYLRSPVGHNTLGSTVSRLCKLAGISGHKTNHFLRATAATRLYHNNVDEQLIMAVTGHKSIDGVRSYKRTSEDQFKHVSDAMRSRSEDEDKKDGCIHIPVNVKNNQENVSFNNSTIPCSPSFSVSGCHSVTINVAK